MRWDASGPIIVWENQGYSQWSPRSYDTLKEALLDQRFTPEFVVTRLTDFKVIEIESAEGLVA